MGVLLIKKNQTYLDDAIQEILKLEIEGPSPHVLDIAGGNKPPVSVFCF